MVSHKINLDYTVYYKQFWTRKCQTSLRRLNFCHRFHLETLYSGSCMVMQAENEWNCVWNTIEPQSLWWHRIIWFELWEDHKHIYRYQNDLEWIRAQKEGECLDVFQAARRELILKYLCPGCSQVQDHLQWESGWSETQKSWQYQSLIQVLSTCTDSMWNKERCS